jgi:hypothetical protein
VRGAREGAHRPRSCARARAYDLDDCFAFSDSYSDVPDAERGRASGRRKPRQTLGLLAKAYSWPELRFAMNHPCLVTLERDSAPACPFAGDRLVEVDLPPGTRCIYPNPPLAPLRDVDAAIPLRDHAPARLGAALREAHAGHEVDDRGRRLVVPLRPMRRPDVRERVLEIVLELCADHGVDDIDIIIATGIPRRLKAMKSATWWATRCSTPTTRTALQPRRRGQEEHRSWSGTPTRAKRWS